MTENTISINMAADAAEDMVLAEETAEKCRGDAQGNDWQNVLEEESDNVQTAADSDAEKTNDAEEKIKLTVYGEEVEVSIEEAKADTDAIRADVLKRVQKLYGYDFIYDVVFREIFFQ